MRVLECEPAWYHSPKNRRINVWIETRARVTLSIRTHTYIWNFIGHSRSESTRDWNSLPRRIDVFAKELFDTIAIAYRDKFVRNLKFRRKLVILWKITWLYDMQSENENFVLTHLQATMFYYAYARLLYWFCLIQVSVESVDLHIWVDTSLQIAQKISTNSSRIL